MELVTPETLHEYLRDDDVLRWMDAESNVEDEDLTCQKWLRQSAPKRFVFRKLFGDLLTTKSNLKILDIGGGLTAFGRLLSQRHDYTLVDVLAHDSARRGLLETAGGTIFQEDWYTFEPKRSYDLVIANDLFPNVDQRLSVFIEKFLPVGRELRLSLTYYPEPRFYMTRRMDADEVMCMLSWNGEDTARALERFSKNIILPQLELLSTGGQSVYPNGRQVCVLSLVGTSD